MNVIIDRMAQQEERTEVLGRRAARGILESSLNYGASRIESNIGSWVGAVSRIPMRKVKSVYCANPKR